MALALTGLTSGAFNSATPSTSENTASISPTANRLIIADIVSTDTSGGAGWEPPVSLTSSGLTWVKIVDVTYSFAGFTVYVSRWRAMAASPGTGAVAINFTTGQTDIYWSIYESNNEVDTTGTNGSGAIVQTVTNTGTGTTFLATLAALGSANNAVIGAFGTEGSGAFTVGSGFTLIHNADNQNILLTEQKLNDTTVDGTYGTSANWAAIATEIKAAVAAAPVIISNRMLTGIGK